MASTQTIVVTAEVKTVPTEKENRFDSTKKDLTFGFVIEEQTIPLGEGKTNVDKSDMIFTSSSNASKSVRETLKKGDRVLLCLRVTGAYKDGYPNAYYANCTHIAILTTAKAKVNTFLGKAQLEKLEPGMIPGTTDLLFREAKQPSGTNKAKIDYSKKDSYHYYKAIYNLDVSKKLEVGKVYFLKGSLAKGVFNTEGLAEDVVKTLNQPVLVIENILF